MVHMHIHYLKKTNNIIHIFLTHNEYKTGYEIPIKCTVLALGFTNVFNVKM